MSKLTFAGKAGFVSWLATAIPKLYRLHPLLKQTYYRLVAKRKATEALRRILHISGYTIHDIINNPQARNFIKQEYKFMLFIARDSVKQYDDTLDRKREFWKQGVLAPEDGGPTSFKDWWYGKDR